MHRLPITANEVMPFRQRLVRSTQLVSAAFGQPFNVVQQPQGQPKTVRNKRLPAAIIHALRAMPVKQFAGHVGGINPTAVLILYLVQAAFAASRSEEHTSELQSLMRISYAVFCLKKKNKPTI